MIKEIGERAGTATLFAEDESVAHRVKREDYWWMLDRIEWMRKTLEKYRSSDRELRQLLDYIRIAGCGAARSAIDSIERDIRYVFEEVKRAHD